MQTAEVTPQPQFAGSDDEQRIAAEVFQTLRAMARFFPKTAPIRATLTAITGFVAERHPERSAEEWASELDRILSLNTEVFAREETDEDVLFITTFDGRPPSDEPTEDAAHMLARRFEEPVPLPERPPEVPLRQRVQPVEEPEALVADVADPEPAELPVEEPAPSVPAEAPAAPAAAVVAQDEIAAMDDAALAAVIVADLRQEPTVANFGDQWMIEEKVPRLSRGDLRRLAGYIVERGEPLSDETLLQDILGISPTADDYEVQRFALNYRLSREHREFEFVGSADDRRWSTQGLIQIDTGHRKASELGQDYRFLLEYPPAPDAPRETVVEHVLTFYEYQYGVLPYDATFAALFPPQFLPDQRAAILEFESPQTLENFHVELRYPTSNRGGYIAGFAKFFHENLVPGALITIEFNEGTKRYMLEYLPISGQDRKLLQLDEKKNRYTFRSTTFYCATQENMLLSENHFPRLANTPPLEERTRRRPEEVLAAAFERAAEQEGTGESRRYMAMIDDLLAAANIERPMSADLIRDIVRNPAYPQFSVDADIEDVFYYQPDAE